MLGRGTYRVGRAAFRVYRSLREARAAEQQINQLANLAGSAEQVATPRARPNGRGDLVLGPGSSRGPASSALPRSPSGSAATAPDPLLSNRWPVFSSDPTDPAVHALAGRLSIRRQVANFPRLVARGVLSAMRQATIVIHGVPILGLRGAVGVNSPAGFMTARRFARYLVNELGWTGGELELLSCDTATRNPFGRIFARQLSIELDQLGATTAIRAPLGDVVVPTIDHPYVRSPNTLTRLAPGESFDWFGPY